MFYLIDKQAYKLKLTKKLKIHNVFYVSLLEQDTIKKGQIDKNDIMKLNTNDNEGGKYKVEAIWDSGVYVIESISHLPGLYYLVL